MQTSCLPSLGESRLDARSCGNVAAWNRGKQQLDNKDPALICSHGLDPYVLAEDENHGKPLDELHTLIFVIFLVQTLLLGTGVSSEQETEI